jgi:hypothetical protein
MFQNFRRKQFIDEYPAMLEIIRELDDVERAIAGFEQMRLRAPLHLTQIPLSGHRLRPMLTGQKLTTYLLSAVRRYILEQSSLPGRKITGPAIG